MDRFSKKSSLSLQNFIITTKRFIKSEGNKINYLKLSNIVDDFHSNIILTLMNKELRNKNIHTSYHYNVILLIIIGTINNYYDYKIYRRDIHDIINKIILTNKYLVGYIHPTIVKNSRKVFRCNNEIIKRKYKIHIQYRRFIFNRFFTSFSKSLKLYFKNNYMEAVRYYIKLFPNDYLKKLQHFIDYLVDNNQIILYYRIL